MRRLVLPPLPVENNQSPLAVPEHVVGVTNHKVEVRSKLQSVKRPTDRYFGANQSASTKLLGEPVAVEMHDVRDLGKNVLPSVLDRFA